MKRTLVVVSSAPGVVEGGDVFLDRKAVEGLARFAELWDGEICCLMTIGDRADLPFGQLYSPAELPCRIICAAEEAPERKAALDDAAIILAAGDNFQDLALVDQARAPVVYIIENILQTRLRINQLYNGYSLQGLKSAIWTIKTEVQRRRAFRRAAGLQCNGVPAFDAYRGLTADALLYFDTRTTVAQLINAPALLAKQDAIGRGRPLRLAFSGRLDPIKGVDHLVPVAAELARLDVAFTLDVYGDGPLRQTMQTQVTNARLEDRITIHGSIPFDALMPRLIAGIDLFLCCHRQADPSCTYTETLSCGVPIVGYDNLAFAGIIARAPVGVAVPSNDIKAMARAVARLDSDRSALAIMAGSAAQFGRDHSFEHEFAARIAQLQTLI